MLYHLFVESDVVAGRCLGATPSPEAFRQMVWREVLAQYVVETSTEPIGCVVAHRPDFRHGSCYVGVYGLEPHRGTGRLLLGARLLVDHLFTNLGFRKVYAEVLEPDLEQFGGGAGSFFEIEGRLRAHYLVGGHRVDLLILAIHRESWRTATARVDAVRSMLGGDPSKVGPVATGPE